MVGPVAPGIAGTVVAGPVGPEGPVVTGQVGQVYPPGQPPPPGEPEPMPEQLMDVATAQVIVEL